MVSRTADSALTRPVPLMLRLLAIMEPQPHVALLTVVLVSRNLAKQAIGLSRSKAQMNGVYASR